MENRLRRQVELPGDGPSFVSASSTEVLPTTYTVWMIVDGSQAWGGYTLRVIRERMGSQERLQHDEYTGILCYNDLT